MKKIKILPCLLMALLFTLPLGIRTEASVSGCSHVFDTTIVDATEDTAGSITYHCIYCGYTYVDTIPMTGHVWGSWQVLNAPSCSDPGTEVRICQNDSSHTETRPVAALGHDYGAWIVDQEPTATTEGHRYRVCSHDASHIIEESIPALSVGGIILAPPTATDLVPAGEDTTDPVKETEETLQPDPEPDPNPDPEPEPEPDPEPDSQPSAPEESPAGFVPNTLDYVLQGTGVLQLAVFIPLILSQLRIIRWDKKQRERNFSSAKEGRKK